MGGMMESEGGRSWWPEWRPRGVGSTGATVFFSVGEERRKEIEREKEKGGGVCVYKWKYLHECHSHQNNPHPHLSQTRVWPLCARHGDELPVRRKRERQFAKEGESHDD